MLDSNLTMGLHTKALSESCFYHICPFRQIRSSLDDATAASVASARVWSCSDQMNYVLYGTALKHIASHSVRWPVVVSQRSRPPFSSNAPMKQLHWLRLE